jgi:Protein of unknown function (DUF2637)
VSTAIAVLAVACVAAYVSYWPAYVVVCVHGETGITARLEPVTIDGLVYSSSMVNLYAARHRLPVPALARWLLVLGIVATLADNMAQGWSHGPGGAVIAAWPVAGQEPDAGPGNRYPEVSGLATVGKDSSRPLVRAARVEQWTGPGPDQADHVDQGADQVGAAAAQVPGGDVIRAEAVSAYRSSVQKGEPRSERKFAGMFGKSRRWARGCMAEARQSLVLA